MLRAILISLLLTEIIEIIIALLFGVRGKALIIIFAANMLTNVIVNTVYQLTTGFVRIEPWLLIAPLEIAAVIAEWLIYRHCGIKKAFLLSLISNAVSFTIGCFL